MITLPERASQRKKEIRVRSRKVKNARQIANESMLAQRVQHKSHLNSLVYQTDKRRKFIRLLLTIKHYSH